MFSRGGLVKWQVYKWVYGFIKSVATRINWQLNILVEVSFKKNNKN